MDFQISLSGVRSAVTRQAVSAHNIANILTPGFKAQRVDQIELAGAGTGISSVTVYLNPGPLEITQGPLDLAIQGDGFFMIKTPQGLRFTRAGVFHIDQEGNIVTPQGFILSPPFTVPTEARSLVVSPSGVVSAIFADGKIQQIGQIQLARFNNPGGLMLEGNNLSAPSPSSGEPIVGLPGEIGLGTLAFGAVEGSNVDLTSEIVQQLLSRAVARANIATLRTQDEILGTILDSLA
jgi:flagellar basal-body rod protein FlgG